MPRRPGSSASHRNLAVKWAGKGIRVNAVVPGLIDTPMTAPMHAAPELVDAELAHIPLRPLRIRRGDRTDGGLLVHRAEQLHQWRALRRRRRVGLRLRRTPTMTTFVRALRPEDFYHTGIVVPDLDAAMARLARWPAIDGSIRSSYTLPVPHRERNPRTHLDHRLLLQAPHLELIQEVPGTPWTAAPGNSVHHLGYFTDNLADTARTLEATASPSK